jgi:hypothetical protein
MKCTVEASIASVSAATVGDNTPSCGAFSGGGDSSGTGRPVTVLPGWVSGDTGIGGGAHMAATADTDEGMTPTGRAGPDGGGSAMPLASSSCEPEVARG